MKDYIRFITFIIFFTIAVLWLNSFIPCPAVIYGSTLPCPLFSTGSIVSVVTGVFLLWEWFLWRVKKQPVPLIGGLFGFYDYPDLNGEWVVTYESSFNYDHKNNKYVTKGEGKATIKQTYSSLCVYGDFGTPSEFESFLSKLLQRENGKWFLVYSYRNKPLDIKLKSAANGGLHEGFCYLEISQDGLQMYGYYSNDEQRKTRGSIKFTRKS